MTLKRTYTDREALEIYIVQRTTRIQRRGIPIPKPYGLDTRLTFRGEV